MEGGLLERGAGKLPHGVLTSDQCDGTKIHEEVPGNPRAETESDVGSSIQMLEELVKLQRLYDIQPKPIEQQLVLEHRGGSATYESGTVQWILLPEWTVGIHGKEWRVDGDSVLQLLTTAWKKGRGKQGKGESKGDSKGDIKGENKRKGKGKIGEGWGWSQKGKGKGERTPKRERVGRAGRN